VRKLRTNKGWSQNQLALKLQLFGWDTSRESVTRLENQSRRVPDLELFVVAKILGVKADDLFPRNLRGKVKEMAPHYRVKLSRGQGSADVVKFKVQSQTRLVIGLLPELEDG
jgi:transcriptional regulator with XRE-family HTH domain